MIADHETALIGQITDSIIDADALVRDEFGGHFPMFEAFRLLRVGERVYARRVKDWWVGFAIALCHERMSKPPCDELIYWAAVSALHRSGDPNGDHVTDLDVASSYNVGEETFRVLRKYLQSVLDFLVDVYGDRMVVAMTKVKSRERRVNDYGAIAKFSG